MGLGGGRHTLPGQGCGPGMGCVGVQQAQVILLLLPHKGEVDGGRLGRALHLKAAEGDPQAALMGQKGVFLLGDVGRRGLGLQLHGGQKLPFAPEEHGRVVGHKGKVLIQVCGECGQVPQDKGMDGGPG